MDYSSLADAVNSSAAIRRRRRLQPAAGAGTKVYPPTYPGEGRNPQPRHVFEYRRIGERDVPCVLIDSVQSQANRLEDGLSEAIADGVPVPTVEVTFEGDGLTELGDISSLRAPHRLFDAILRDSALDRVPFMKSPLGLRIQSATLADASAILESSPSALIFGVWNSTGEGGGLGAKFPRVLTSEIIGVDVPVFVRERADGTVAFQSLGARTGSRIDPLGILRRVEVYKTASGAWDTDPKRVESKGDKAKKVRPSEVNHGNIAPSVVWLGVTMAYAEHATVLSLAGLRRLRFAGAFTPAARSYLAALALLAVTEQDRAGYALRSRCDLVPEGPAPFELVHADGTVESFDLDAPAARALYTEALEALGEAGLPLRTQPVRLTPQPKLVEIIRRSRELALQGEGGDEDAADAGA